VSPFIFLLGAWLVNSVWPLIGQDGVRLFSVPLFCFAGTAVGALALSPWLLRGGRWRRALDPGLARPLLVMAICNSAASLIYLKALLYTSPANASVMAQSEVLYSALLSAWLLKERIGSGQALASLLVLAGTGLIMAQDLGSPRWKGDLMILLTPWIYQVSHVCAKRLPRDLDPILLSGTRLGYGLLVLAPLAVWSLAHGGNWTWSREGCRLLLAQGIVMNALSLVCWYGAILRMDLAKATAFLLSYPALTMLFSWAWGRERISGPQLAGLAVTMAGAGWLTRITLAAGDQRSALTAPATSGWTKSSAVSVTSTPVVAQPTAFWTRLFT
jgi:drug/metabolite transporter (DMT)-like permease